MPVSQKRLTDEEELSFGLPASRPIHSHPCGTTCFEKDSVALPLPSRGSLAS